MFLEHLILDESIQKVCMELDSWHLIFWIYRTQMRIVDECAILPYQYGLSSEFFLRNTIMEYIGKRIGRISFRWMKESDACIFIRVNRYTANRGYLVGIIIMKRPHATVSEIFSVYTYSERLYESSRSRVLRPKRGNDIFFDLGIDRYPGSSRVCIERKDSSLFILLHPSADYDIFVLVECFFEDILICSTIREDDIEPDRSHSHVFQMFDEIGIYCLGK